VIIQCRKCGTRYRFDREKITGKGIWVRCRNCETVFFQKNPSTEISSLMGLMANDQETPPNEVMEERSDILAETESREDAEPEPSWEDAFGETDADKADEKPETEEVEQEPTWEEAFGDAGEGIEIEKGEALEDTLGEGETADMGQESSWDEALRETEGMGEGPDRMEGEERVEAETGTTDIVDEIIKEEDDSWDTGEGLEIDREAYDQSEEEPRLMSEGEESAIEQGPQWEEDYEEEPGEETEGEDLQERQRVREPWDFGDVDEDLYDEKTAKGTGKGRRIIGKIVLILILIALLLACAYLWVFPEARESLSKRVFAPIEQLLGTESAEKTKAALPAVSSDTSKQNKHGTAQETPPALTVVLKDVAERFVKGWTGQTIMVVEGSAMNTNTVPVSNIRVQGKILDSSGAVISKEMSSCGTILTDDELKGMTSDEIKKELSHPYGRDFRNAGIKPDEGIPFMLVFIMPDAEASELVVELIGIEASQNN